MTSPSLVCDDVLHWAETYQGEKFHALLADPPYGLGFMGASWDDFARTKPYKARTEAGYGHTGILPGYGRGGTDSERRTYHAKSMQEYGRFMTESLQALAQHLLPGAFGLCFGSARGWHRLACAIEDAGLILHPSVFMLGWAYGSGFPKATRIDTAVDKAAGVEQEVTGYQDSRSRYDGRERHSQFQTPWGPRFSQEAYTPVTAPATDLAATWAGHRYGLQALKPALEPIIVWQKPYQGSPVESITATGAGAVWIDGGRLGMSNEDQGMLQAKAHKHGAGDTKQGYSGGWRRQPDAVSAKRWPPNLALVHLPTCTPLGPSQSFSCAPECLVRSFDLQAGERMSNSGAPFQRHPDEHRAAYGHFDGGPSGGYYGDSGPASRFMCTADWSLDVAEQLAQADPVFYTGKASRGERDEGLSGLAPQVLPEHDRLVGTTAFRHDARVQGGGYPVQKLPQRNPHPTVKPIALCQWLATLLLPPAAYAPRRLLNPFAGSGSEAIGAVLAGWDEIVGIEQDPATVAVGRQRLTWWTTQIAAQLSLWPS